MAHHSVRAEKCRTIFFAVRPSFQNRAILSHSNRRFAEGTMNDESQSGLHHPPSLRQCRTAVAVRVVWSDCRKVDVACRHVWNLRLHFIFYYLMRHEPYGRRTTVVAVCERALRHELSSPARTLGSWIRIPIKAWMFVCVYSVCIGSGLATGWSPIQGVSPAVLRLSNWNETKRFTDALCSKVGATGKRERETERCEMCSATWNLNSIYSRTE
jgi:hypothetical protein